MKRKNLSFKSLLVCLAMALIVMAGHAAGQQREESVFQDPEGKYQLQLPAHWQAVNYQDGAGNALFERMVYDEEAQPLSTNYADYLLPSAPEMPRVEIMHLEQPSPLNPIGVKGAGEGGTIPAAACIVSAIEDALAPFGVKLAEHPLSPEAILAVIRNASAQP